MTLTCRTSSSWGTFEGRDRIIGSSGIDGIRGGEGNDLIDGGDGADNIFGGEGNDRINGGDGADSIQGDETSNEVWRISQVRLEELV